MLTSMSSVAPHTDPAEGHTARVFDTALAELRLHVVAMGGLAIDQVSMAVRALLDGDADLAGVVLSREPRINELERNVDREAFRLIALHQPMAGDLRMAKAASRITVELERVGDEAKKIARFANRLATGEPQGPVRAVARYLRHMADLTTGMLREASSCLSIQGSRAFPGLPINGRPNSATLWARNTASATSPPFGEPFRS